MPSPLVHVHLWLSRSGQWPGRRHSAACARAGRFRGRPAMPRHSACARTCGPRQASPAGHGRPENVRRARAVLYVVVYCVLPMQMYGLQAAALRVSQRRHLLFSLRRQAGEAAVQRCAVPCMCMRPCLGLGGRGSVEVPELDRSCRIPALVWRSECFLRGVLLSVSSCRL